MNTSPSSYVIPDHMSQLSKATPWLAFLVTVPLGAVLGLVTSSNLSDGAVGGAVGGFFGGIPVVVLIATVRGFSLVRKMKKVWAAHTYAWYCKTFPANVHAKGRVSCRHCGGDHVQVRNLMNRTFMRAHFCAQCGETLYFSPEKA